MDNTGGEDRIVAVFGDEELDLAMECWLETYGRSQVYTLPLMGDVTEDDFETYTFGNYMVMIRK